MISVNFCRPFLLNQKQDVGWLLLRNRSSRPEVFCRTSVLKNFRVSFLLKLQVPPATLLKKRIWSRCFPVNFAKCLRTTFFIEHIWWLLLKKVCRSTQNMFFTHYNQSNTFLLINMQKTKTCPKQDLAAKATCFDIRILTV